MDNEGADLQWANTNISILKLVYTICETMYYLSKLFTFKLAGQFRFNLWLKKVSEYDQEIPQSHTADQPVAA